MVVKRITVTTTRLLGKEGKGTGTLGFGPPQGITKGAGWDTDTLIYNQNGGNDEKTLLPHDTGGDHATWIANRFIPTTTSAARILVQLFGVRRPSTAVDTDHSFLQCGIFDDTTEGNPAGLLSIVGAGELIVGLLGGPAKKPNNNLQGGWNSIPLNNIIKTGADSPIAPNPPGNNFYVEFSNPNLFSPGKPLWLVLTTISANSNIYVQDNHNNPLTGGNFEAKSTDGKTWTQDFTRGFTMQVYSQLSLTSAGTSGYGGGNGLTIFEPLTGKGHVATTTDGFQQTASVIDFSTQSIVRKNAQGNVDVSFVTSVADGTPPNQQISRWDYGVTVQYEKF